MATTFRREVCSIIEKGRSLGLPDEDILKLFDVTVAGAGGRQKKSWARCVCGWFLVVNCSAIAFFILLSISLNYKPTEYYIDHYAHHLAYPLLRYSRLLTLPLSTRVDMTSLYYTDCLLGNPFLEVERDCSICEDLSEVRIVDHDNLEVDLGESWEQPVVWKDIVPQDVSLDIFVDSVQKNINVFQSTMKIFASENSTIHSVDELVDRGQDLSSYPDIFLLWQVRGSGALKLVRDMSWRPTDVETSPMMYIQVKGHAAGETMLPLPGEGDSSALVTQAQGHSMVKLSAVKACQDHCKTSIMSTLSPRDILSFDQQYWELRTTPQGSEVNLLFASFFY